MNANPWSGLEVVATVFKQYLKPEQLITTVSIGEVPVNSCICK